MKRNSIFTRSFTALALMLVLCTTACTHNRGDIGHLFGAWKLLDITIDGTPDETYPGNVFWNFQSHVIKMQAVRGIDTFNSFGSWEQPDDATLVLNFTHSDATPGSTPRYSPVSETHLPRGVLTFEVDELTRSRMKLTYIGADGKTYIYTLKKWG